MKKQIMCVLAAVAMVLPVGAQEVKEQVQTQHPRHTEARTQIEVGRNDRGEARERVEPRRENRTQVEVGIRPEQRAEHRERTETTVREHRYGGFHLFRGHRGYHGRYYRNGIWLTGEIIYFNGCQYFFDGGCWYPVYPDCGVIVCE